MPMTLSDTTACLAGDCAVEDAEPLLDWLRCTPDPMVNLSACEHMHTAILQTLLALRPRLSAMPADAMLLRLLRAVEPPLCGQPA